MLHEEVEHLVSRYEERREGLRVDLMAGARKIILSVAEKGSKKSFMFVSDEYLSEFAWLKKELRREGIVVSVQGSTLHFNVTGPPRRNRRALHRNDPNDPEYAY